MVILLYNDTRLRENDYRRLSGIPIVERYFNDNMATSMDVFKDIFETELMNIQNTPFEEPTIYIVNNVGKLFEYMLQENNIQYQQMVNILLSIINNLGHRVVTNFGNKNRAICREFVEVTQDIEHFESLTKILMDIESNSGTGEYQRVPVYDEMEDETSQDSYDYL